MLYAQSTDSLPDALTRLQKHLTELPDQLMALSDTALTEKKPGKWSRKEVLGHLIDSAINNLQRFTEAYSLTDELAIRPYNQTTLVIANQYQQVPLTDLLTLWSSLNRQIGYVAAQLPIETLALPIRLTSGQTDKDVAWLICDYVAHLEHHLQTL